MVQNDSEVFEDRFVKLRRYVELCRRTTTAFSGGGLPNFK